MSRLYKQIQQAQPKEQVFIGPLKPSIERGRDFNVFPSFCIISLLIGILIAYFYTDEEVAAPSLPQKEIDITSCIKKVQEPLAEKAQEPFKPQESFLKPFDVNTPIPESERNFDNIPFEEAPTLAEAKGPSNEITIHPTQWNLAPLKAWIQEHLNRALPKLQEVKNSLNRFAYLDINQAIPEKEVSSTEKERLELIRRFLKKFRVDAVRIDGSYSRIMANGQAYYVNTVISQRPHLKLTGITSQEMIFKDEYNQEYKKEISQND